MQRRIQDLRRLLSGSRMNSSLEAKEGDSYYQGLLTQLPILETQTKSTFQFNEEIHAFIHVAAYAARHHHSEQDNRDTFYPEFHAFFSQLKTATVPDQDLYRQILDWGSFIQAKCPQLKTSKEAAPFLKQCSPDLCDEDPRKKSYAWYIEGRKKQCDKQVYALNEKIEEEEWGYYCGTILCFFIPFVFFCKTGMRLTADACEKNNNNQAYFHFFGSLFLSLVPPISAVFNFFICRKRMKTAELRRDNILSSSNYVMCEELTPEDYQQYKDFHKEFKTNNGSSKKHPADHYSRHKKIVELNNLPKTQYQVIDREFKSVNSSVKMYQIFMNREQHWRYLQYKEYQKAGKKFLPLEEKRDFFEKINQSKQRSRELSMSVLEMHENQARVFKPV